VVGLGQAGDPFGGGGEGDPVSGLAGSDGQAGREVGLAGAWCYHQFDLELSLFSLLRMFLRSM
jgi:hypothetical protein